MNIRRNQMIFGIMLLIIGVCAFVNPGVGWIFKSAYALMLCGGVALIALYYKKRLMWALIGGAYFAYLGFVNVIAQFANASVPRGVIGGAFFIVPGLIFISLYFVQNKRGLLTPGCLLLSFGMFLALNSFSFFRQIDGLTNILLGAGLVAAYCAERTLPAFKKKFKLLLGVVLIVSGLVANLPFSIGSGLKWLAVILIAAGACYIYKAVKRRK
ncbi:hypothetical protein FACS189490_05390 [Clostridia bacterium]|nr:hypothetical protein FACS189490_05390 [Clostridia bacterium]